MNRCQACRCLALHGFTTRQVVVQHIPRVCATLLQRRSSNVAFAEVQTNMLGTPSEAARAVQCVQRMADMAAKLPESFALQQIAPPAGAINETMVRATTMNSFHFVGACSVGSVLDGELKVKGFDNLRVVDASAIPAIPRNAGPASSVFMLAEHVAERIASTNVAAQGACGAARDCKVK